MTKSPAAAIEDKEPALNLNLDGVDDDDKNDRTTQTLQVPAHLSPEASANKRDRSESAVSASASTSNDRLFAKAVK